MFARLSFLVVLAGPSGALGQSSPAIPRIELKGGEKISVANQFATGAVDPVRCDRDGNVYMRPVSGQATSLSGQILRISSDGLNSMPFNPGVVPEFKEAKDIAIEDFTVSRDGQVYALVSILDKEGKSNVVVLEFSDDGHSASLTRIDAGFQPRQMALFFSGQFLLSGLWQSDPPKNKAGFSAESEREQRPFLGIFDRRGKLVQEVHLPGDVRFDPPAKPDSKNAENPAGTAVDLSRAVTGEDGSVYFLRPGPRPTIYVISSAGEVLRHFAINPPSEHAKNSSVFLAAGRLAFDFFEPGSKSSPRTRLLVLVVDAQTGAELWIYEPSRISMESQPATAAKTSRFYR